VGLTLYAAPAGLHLFVTANQWLAPLAKLFRRSAATLRPLHAKTRTVAPATIRQGGPAACSAPAGSRSDKKPRHVLSRLESFENATVVDRGERDGCEALGLRVNHDDADCKWILEKSLIRTNILIRQCGQRDSSALSSKPSPGGAE